MKYMDHLKINGNTDIKLNEIIVQRWHGTNLQ